MEASNRRRRRGLLRAGAEVVMSPHAPPRRRGAFCRALAFGLVATLLAGCFSVRSRRGGASEPGVEGGTVTLTLYADDASRRAGTPGPSGVASELACRDGRDWKPVFRSLQPTWTVSGLPAGRCRVSFRSQFDERGGVAALDERSRDVKVRAGEVTEVEATLRHVSKPMVVAGVAAGVVAAVLLHEWLGDHDLPTPPLPPVPPPWVAEVAVHLVVDLALTYPVGPSGPYGPGPVVSGHHPDDGASVAPGRFEIVFALAQPLDLARLDSGGALVVDGRGRPVSGYLQYDAERWWLVWVPDGPLAPGHYRVVLAADAVEDRAGRTLGSPVAFAFFVR
jgi:hypothetical protein